MSVLSSDAPIAFDRDLFLRSFDREPFGFDHTLSNNDLFALETLRALSESYRPEDYFVASGARAPQTEFYSVRRGAHRPHEAIDLLDEGGQRILLKRPENYDRRFRDLLVRLFAHIVEAGNLSGEQVVRLESSILISSSDTITPFHFDPEISFFFQIEGGKTYRAYSPLVVKETELEAFYVRNEINIGQLDYAGRDPSHEHVFELAPGKGMHQPRNAPHWVQTRATRSISYVFSFDTQATRSIGRTRAANHYLRHLGFTPPPPGAEPSRDALKAGAMELLIRARKGAGTLLRSARLR
jgi:hypothetical protein